MKIIKIMKNNFYDRLETQGTGEEYIYATNIFFFYTLSFVIHNS